MYDTFTSAPKLFVDKMIKKWMNSHIKVVAQLAKFVKWNKDNKKKEPMYISIEEWMNILNYIYFQNFAM